MSKVQTIQATGKLPKLLSFVGRVVFVFAFAGVLLCLSDPERAAVLEAATFVAIAGLGLMCAGRVLTWWRHE